MISTVKLHVIKHRYQRRVGEGEVLGVAAAFVEAVSSP
jgi:hypothetical protein